MRSGKRRYSPQFRVDCVSLVRGALGHYSSREEAVVAIAQTVEIPVTTLRNWVRAELGAARTAAVPADADLRVRRLEQQLADAQRAIALLSSHSVDHS